MAKAIKFNLILDDKPVRNIKGLQENFCIDDVIEVYRKGILKKWLKVRGYQEYLDKVKKIQAYDSKSIIFELIKIFDIGKSEKEIMEAIYPLNFWEERKIKLKRWLEMDNDLKKIISDYHNGYNELNKQLEKNKEDMPFMKAAAGEIYDKYFEIFKIDFEYFFNRFKKNVPLIIFAILMNANLRNYFLENKNIKSELSKKFILSTYEEREYFYDNFDSLANLKASEDESEEEDERTKKEKIENIKNFNRKIGLHLFSGQTDGYWKDLEIESKKVMLLSIPAGTFVRNAGKHGEELSAKDINGNFLILEGLDYKSNNENDYLIYMEV